MRSIGSDSLPDIGYVIIRAMHPVPRRFRWAKFLRQFLPANPTQIVLLLAAVCLSACFGRSWLVLPGWQLLDQIGPLSRGEIAKWVYLTQIFAFPLLLAGVGAYFCCLWRRDDPARSWLRLVLIPATIGIVGGLLVPALIVLNTRPKSVLESHGLNPLRGFKFPTRILTLNLGIGFQIAIVGLACGIVGWWMLRTRVASLPLRFASANETERIESDLVPTPLHFFSLYALCLFGVVAGFLSVSFTPLAVNLLNRLESPSSTWFFGAQYLLNDFPFLLLAAWVLGEDRWKKLLAVARLPQGWLLGLAVLIAVAAHWAPHVLAYASDRFAWAHQGATIIEMPSPNVYLRFPTLTWALLLYAISAVLSEWVWRGCIQGEFIGIFGVSRGLFLVGLLYGSVQQLSFPALFAGVADFFSYLVLRLLWGIVWSVVFGWLTLRARSVWPAAMCAGLSTVLAHAAMIDAQEVIPRRFIRLWLLGSGCVLAFLLVRYLPLPLQQKIRLFDGESGLSEPAS